MFDKREGFLQAEAYRQASLSVTWVETARCVVDGGANLAGRVNPVLMSFACEMYLKCLVCETGQEPNKNHRLDKHWSRLPKNQQLEIEDTFKHTLIKSEKVSALRVQAMREGRPAKMPSMRDTLYRLRSTFIDTRYSAVEGKAHHALNFVHEAGEAIRQYITTKTKYDWAESWMKDDWYFEIERLDRDPSRIPILPGSPQSFEARPDKPKVFDKNAMIFDNRTLDRL